MKDAGTYDVVAKIDGEKSDVKGTIDVMKYETNIWTVALKADANSGKLVLSFGEAVTSALKDLKLTIDGISKACLDISGADVTVDANYADLSNGNEVVINGAKYGRLFLSKRTQHRKQFVT